MIWELLGLGGLAASLLLCVGLFVSLKREIGTLRRRADHDRSAWAGTGRTHAAAGGAAA